VSNKPPPGPAPPEGPESGGRNITGLTSTQAAGLVVLAGWIGAIFLYLNERDDRFVRFYSLQVLAHFCLFLGSCAIAAVLGMAGELLNLPFRFPLLVLLSLPFFGYYWLLMLVSAFRGRIYLLPVAGRWCRAQAGL
jgi:uncharacterized membrane protein